MLVGVHQTSLRATPRSSVSVSVLAQCCWHFPRVIGARFCVPRRKPFPLAVVAQHCDEHALAWRAAAVGMDPDRIETRLAVVAPAVYTVKIDEFPRIFAPRKTGKLHSKNVVTYRI